jgi:UDP-N-acetylmuramyl pentapeptide synthase
MGRSQKLAIAAALASKLGIDQSKVAAALQTVHQQLGNGTTPPSQAQLAAALAKALGVDQSKVATALKAVGPPGPPPSGQLPQGAQAPPQSGQMPTPPAQSS